MAPYKVLMVWTGNICRSPMAEAVLRHKLAAAGLDNRVAVDSAGTSDLHQGEPPNPRAISRAGQRGYDLNEQRSRPLTPGDFEDFDLILCMDRGHLGALVRHCPPERHQRVRLFMDFSPLADVPDEVPDPYYGGVADYDHALDLIEPAVEGLVAHLRETLR